MNSASDVKLGEPNNAHKSVEIIVVQDSKSTYILSSCPIISRSLVSKVVFDRLRKEHLFMACFDDNLLISHVKDVVHVGVLAPATLFSFAESFQ